MFLFNWISLLKSSNTKTALKNKLAQPVNPLARLEQISLTIGEAESESELCTCERELRNEFARISEYCFLQESARGALLNIMGQALWQLSLRWSPDHPELSEESIIFQMRAHVLLVEYQTRQYDVAWHAIDVATNLLQLGRDAQALPLLNEAVKIFDHYLNFNYEKVCGLLNAWTALAGLHLRQDNLVETKKILAKLRTLCMSARYCNMLHGEYVDVYLTRMANAEEAYQLALAAK